MTSLLFASRDIIYLYSFFLGKMLYYLHAVTYNNNKNGEKKTLLNNMVTNQDIAYQDSIAFFLRLDIFVPIISWLNIHFSFQEK